MAGVDLLRSANWRQSNGYAILTLCRAGQLTPGSLGYPEQPECDCIKPCATICLSENARMAKSADAADLKSVGLKWLWGFKSPSGHHRINNLMESMSIN
jgi:hypothetical protein